MDDPRAIRNDDDLAAALKEIAAYFDRAPAPGTIEADDFEKLCNEIEAYENLHHPIET